MAVPAIGANSYIVIGRETTFGTIAGAATGKKIAFVKESIKGAKKLIQSQLLGGDPNPRDPVLGRQDASGNLTIYAGVTSAPQFFEWALGSRATTGASAPYTHKHKVSAGTLPSFSVETYIPTATAKFKQLLGGTINTMSMSMGDEGFLELNFGLAGTGVNALASSANFTSPTDWTTENVYDMLKATSALVKVNGSANAQILSFDLQLNHNVDTNHFVIGGGGIRKSLTRRRATVTGNIKIAFEDTTIYDLAAAGTYTSVDITLTYASGFTLQVWLPRVLLEKTEPVVDQDGMMTCTFSIVGSKDSTEATALEIVVVNDQAGTVYA